MKNLIKTKKRALQELLSKYDIPTPTKPFLNKLEIIYENHHKTKFAYFTDSESNLNNPKIQEINLLREFTNLPSSTQNSIMETIHEIGNKTMDKVAIYLDHIQMQLIPLVNEDMAKEWLKENKKVPHEEKEYSMEELIQINNNFNSSQSNSQTIGYK